VIAVGTDGLVRGGGVANSLEQVEELLAGVLDDRSSSARTAGKR
jgi:hypothetical protein